MERLLSRGVRHFKFVDRTFNLNLNIGRSILDFFWQRYTPGLFLHFEMIPDRLPEALASRSGSSLRARFSSKLACKPQRRSLRADQPPTG